MMRVVVLLAWMVACGGPADTAADAGADASRVPDAAVSTFPWRLPPGFPVPKVPPDNPMSAEKVVLGRHLFYDTRLSLNQTQSCASCHQQALAFTDGKSNAVDGSLIS